MNQIEVIRRIATMLSLRPNQVETALNLFAQGNTVPFIARYRKEATQLLDEVQLRQIRERYDYEEKLARRKETVRQALAAQNALTEDLADALAAACVLQDVEDLYRPFKPTRRTKAAAAREAGLKPLAELFRKQVKNGPPPEKAAEAYLTNTVKTADAAIQGAMYILSEDLAGNSTYRRYLREELWKTARLSCTLTVADAEAGPMLTYKNFNEKIRRLLGYRMLAINRGEAQKLLKSVLQTDTDKHIAHLVGMIISGPSPYVEILKDAAKDSYQRLIFPQLEREIRSELTASAEKQAISVFADNLRSLLLQPPFAGQVIMGLDPGYRTGCKCAVIDATGKVLDHGTYHLVGSKKQQQDAAEALTAWVKKHGITLISIGNGTASYETEQFVSHLIQHGNLTCSYMITNEAGASVYSASMLAREELPDLDVTIRGAVSIARRIQDPLAEAVKIDPKAIGVGQYQHDVDQKMLSAALDDVVESVVNAVGVDLNTASAALLRHVAGLTATTAANIVAYRKKNGPFRNRQDLNAVPRLGPSTFMQCAGFLRIKDGEEPLDNTAVHPESYALAKKILQHCGIHHEERKDTAALHLLQSKLPPNATAALAEKLHAGEPTIRDILTELRKPGRDLRDTMPQPLTRQKILSLDELQIGTTVRGTVQNVVDFGAFVDFGLKTPGLVHRSKLCRKPFCHPLDVVRVGDIVDAVIVAVDSRRGRISLSMTDVANNDTGKTTCK